MLFYPALSRRKQRKAADALKAFDTFYLDSLKKYGIVGSSFAFVHDNKVLDKQVYGISHIANNSKVDDDTIFHWASITKTLTGIAIMQLRGRGKLKLEDPMTKYVPELRTAHNQLGHMRQSGSS